jgi:hypothetical protein
MAKRKDDLLDLARAVSERLAGGSLTPACAKLYSQHTRLDAGQPGLRQWRAREAEARLDEAVRLIEAGLIQRDGDDEQWTEAVLRAAELLEWLSHPSLNPESLPIHLMSAAAYQLAGYPARAAGLLNMESRSNERAGALQFLLRGDFPRLLSQLSRYWGGRPRIVSDSARITWSEGHASNEQLRRLVEDETAGALGVMCAALRWGEETRIEPAIEKLYAIAKFMLNGRDNYSWFLAKLVAESASVFYATALRSKLAWLPNELDTPGKTAVERYIRQAYQSCKTQVWPSQQRGIDRLVKGDSFVLCTPTGSGKTTVAEIAILQRLFSSADRNALPDSAPLVMYLVPKRALAAEVEAKLLRTIAPLSGERIVITGLYGGIDWGPTDAWLTATDRTVLICTYEKAEALIRFLGPLFLGRLSLVVLDEAHLVQFDGNEEALLNAESRSLRLESLIARLLAFIPSEQSQVIALSAVAAGMESTLAKWVTGDDKATPARTLYRSTRQLIGRLQCKAGRGFDIRYDLLDRASLRFDETGEGGTPFIPGPFPPYPAAPGFEAAGPEKKLRPYLFWAAMHLVAPPKSARRHAVLISIPQKIGGYAEDLLNLIDDDWSDSDLPQVFQPPADADKNEKWLRCLDACEDYFGKTSREYRLLEKGIVAHHGKMPGLMARLLIQLVNEGVVHLILATSTLSEGVNLPFEVVLLPTLRRNKDMISPREFANLAGRAGRPGFGTEGKCLVLLPAESTDWSSRQAKAAYEDLIKKLEVKPDDDNRSAGGSSALASLLTALWTKWTEAAGSDDEGTFIKWLEVTATLTEPISAQAITSPKLIDALDSLDSVLLAAIVEVESIAGAPLNATELEDKLAEIWRRCYAHYASQYEVTLGKWFRLRGQAIVAGIYPDADQRRRLYRSGLPPRLGELLARLYPQVRDYLIAGADFIARDSDGRFEFIKGLVALLGTHPKFALAKKTPPKATWEELLRWWLDPKGPVPMPSAKQVSDWYDYVATNFGYRFAWGIGCTLALATNDAHAGELKPTTLESWSDLKLPWIALWLKELVVWGTLDPVAAYLLGRGRAGTRGAAGVLAAEYYEIYGTLDPNEQLDPRTIRNWADTLPRVASTNVMSKPNGPFKATLERTFPEKAARRWRVLPVEQGETIQWIDPAGYLLASGELPAKWKLSFLDDGDFFLDVDSHTVQYQAYI